MFKKSAFILGLLIFSLGSFAEVKVAVTGLAVSQEGKTHGEFQVGDGSSTAASVKVKPNGIANAFKAAGISTDSTGKSSAMLLPAANSSDVKPLPTADDSIAAYQIPAVITAVVLAVAFIGYKVYSRHRAEPQLLLIPAAAAVNAAATVNAAAAANPIAAAANPIAAAAAAAGPSVAAAAITLVESKAALDIAKIKAKEIKKAAVAVAAAAAAAAVQLTLDSPSKHTRSQR